MSETQVDKAECSTNTIFDDVFRTIAEKFPQMFIGLINEVFHTDYPENITCKELKNEHYTKNGKVITDALIEIQSHLYHIECQSGKDGRMVIRMFEYDVAIAMENAISTDRGMEIKFPESCVVYIRSHRTVPKSHELTVCFSDGQKILYHVPVIKVSDYSIDDLFKKKLLAFIPYYILRYESFLKSNSMDVKKTENLLLDMSLIAEKLEECFQTDESMYVDMMNLTLRICSYIIPDENQVKRKVGDVMGGKVLQLQSEVLKREGQAELSEAIMSLQQGMTYEYLLSKGIDEETLKQAEKIVLSFKTIM